MRAVTATQVRAAIAGLCALVLVIAAGVALAQTGPDFPALTGRVVDNAGLLDAGQEADLTGRLEALENRTTDQFVIVTLASLQGWTIEEFGYRLGRHWGIGQQGKNNGVLLLVAPDERKVRIEVGYGLEGTLTDALSSVIVQQTILPRFRSGDMAGGIMAGADDIIAVLAGEGEAVADRLASRPETGDFVFSVVFFLFFGLILALILISILRGTRGGRSGGWSAGSSGGWSGSSGGGFSGGGGSFGGGGSSGSW